MSTSSTTTEAHGPIPAAALEAMRRAPTHPGEIMADWLDDAGIAHAEAARRIGVTRGMLSQVRTGRKPMSAALCVKLAKLFGTSVEFWGALQMRHDLWHALQDHAAALKAITPLPTEPVQTTGAVAQPDRRARRARSPRR